MIGFWRENVKMLRLHVAPIIMLEVGGAVAEKCGEANAQPSVQASEYVVLQAIEQTGAPPAEAWFTLLRSELPKHSSCRACR